MSDNPHPTCDVCGKPMIANGHTAFYAGVRHWDCQYPNGFKSTEEVFADIRETIGKAEAAINRLRRNLK